MIDVPIPRVILLAVVVAIAALGCSSDGTTTKSVGSAPERTPASAVSSPRSVAEAADVVEVGVPQTIEIPDIEVDAELVGVGLAESGVMETPAYDSNQAGWYTEGPMPGEDGPSVVIGHVDSTAGPDVFWRLRELEHGDEVTVTDGNGREYEWTVDRVDQADKDSLPVKEIWQPTSEPMLTLITCAGEFLVDEYEDNLIVYLEPEGQ